MKKKIIFLDCDGVINGYNFWFVLGWRIVLLLHSKKLRFWYRTVFDPYGVHKRKVKRLVKIVNKTGAKIVMSSTWRHAFMNTPYEKMPGDLKKLTDLFLKYRIEVINITPTRPNNWREDEIYDWLTMHVDEVESYVVLDDEIFDLGKIAGYGRLVQTKTTYKNKVLNRWFKKEGLTQKHVKEAISILNRKWDCS